MGINCRLRGAASGLALAIFGVALMVERAAAQVVPQVELPYVDTSSCFPFRPGFPCVFTTATTLQVNSVTNVILPDTSGVGGSGPVQDQVNLLLAGSHAAAIHRALDGVMDAPSLTFLSRVLDDTISTSTSEDFFGDSLRGQTLFVGPERSIPVVLQPPWSGVNFIFTTTNFFTDTFQATNGLSAAGLGWLSGDLHTTFQTVLLDDGFGFTDTLLLRGRRSAGAYGAIIAAGLGGEPLQASLGDGWSTWSKSAYRNGSFDDTASNFGFAADGFSSAYGLEHADGEWLTGVAVGYSTLNSKQDVTGDKGDLQAFKAGLYASYHPGDWTFTGSATGSFQTIKSKRLVNLPTPATADYDATSFNLGFEAARRFALSENAFFEPTGGFIYSHLHSDSFTEAGGGGLGISVDAENTDALKAYIGARLASTLALNDGMTITPELRGRFVYDVLGDNRDLTASFADVAAATPFAVSGLEPKRAGGIIGAGLTLASTTNWQATTSYDAEIRGGDVLHTARGGFTWAF